ncbi:biotin-dependent carboxyltransferase family protein [Rhizobium lusitanum]|uniref:5-oxoprolinase subunit C family protein n=1 Tax=Rhizobium lusitanum TaxID=293958 RepID=UPI00195EB63C|nr:biotin-dependent carboxyltransferase family protein [Rhizobium lusitanum]MBM7045800.1 biotin-dependent carboxyltransferase family protein [Rhizobium lusitanum]
MKHLRILQAGPMLTVQDLGRKGLLHAGVSGSGPMDAPSFRIANALVGNTQDMAALEFASAGGTFEVAEPVRFAVTGGDVDIRIDGSAMHPWESHNLFPGSILHIGGLRSAVWGYLAFSGGIDTPLILGSRATHLRTGLGGHEGRCLRAGDLLPIGSLDAMPLLALTKPWRRSNRPINVVAGPQGDYFDALTWRRFLGSSFVVSSSRDRMAQMLDGPAIAACRGHDIVSDGTTLGSIQVPSSGRLIVLMAERQTTGGYPKIATVASVDVPRLAQTPSGLAIRFRLISQAAAEALLVAERQALQDVIVSLSEKTTPMSVAQEVAL